MSPHPDEHSALEHMAARLRAAEPQLAAMFGIFTWLTAHEGLPPDEDQIGPARPAPPARPSPAARPRRTSPLRVVLIPAVLLIVMVVTITVALSGSRRCAPPDRASVFAYQSAQVSACTQATRTSGAR